MRLVFLLMIELQLIGASYHHFPVTPVVRDQVSFWEKIFTLYPQSSVVIHDVDHPRLIIDVIDFQKLSKSTHRSILSSRKQQEQYIAAYKQRYNKAVERFRTLGRSALKFGKIEERMFQVYSQNPQNLKDLYTGKVKIRHQTGLADEFARAVGRSKLYMSQMEKIFKSHGLSTDLTRIAFVESMFNPKALSKVGASGVWQFMPLTAKDFLRVDSYIDERNSPLKATTGAAQLLRNNYRLLQSWPLAITAYNHGAGGMQQAVRQLNTRDLSVIIQHHKSRTFGFASKNFYAEFIAARNVFQKLYDRGYREVHLASLRLPKPMSIAEIIRQTPLNLNVFKTYNLCVQERGFTKYYNQPLPKNFEIFVPKPLERDVQHAMKQVNVHNRRL
jgi:membrane-bound lytic murein transglycosylase D